MSDVAQCGPTVLREVEKAGGENNHYHGQTSKIMVWQVSWFVTPGLDGLAPRGSGVRSPTNLPDCNPTLTVKLTREVALADASISKIAVGRLH